MIKVVEDIFNTGDDLPDDLEGYNKVNAIYHPPKGDNPGYYVIDFETCVTSMRVAVKRFLKACKKDPVISKNVSDIINTDLNNRSDINNWIEWFSYSMESESNMDMFKPSEGQQVSCEINPYDDKYNYYYFAALLMEEDE